MSGLPRGLSCFLHYFVRLPSILLLAHGEARRGGEDYSPTTAVYGTAVAVWYMVAVIFVRSWSGGVGVSNAAVVGSSPVHQSKCC